jgi:hypothetical protein
MRRFGDCDQRTRQTVIEATEFWVSKGNGHILGEAPLPSIDIV